MGDVLSLLLGWAFMEHLLHKSFCFYVQVYRFRKKGFSPNISFLYSVAGVFFCLLLSTDFFIC